MQQNNNIQKEPLITREWNFSGDNTRSTSNGILITGTNSFLGVHIIKLLQKQWSGKIHLLVRAENSQAAVAKMETAFNAWNLGTFETGNNTKIYTGEVCKPQMGLPHKIYEELNDKVGFVLHLAMVPLYHLPYSRFKSQWLPELEQMINFCGNNNVKSLHYPSSYNANFFTTDEDFEHLNTNAWQSGYAGFKWVANQVLRNAFNHGLKGCIYDIPLVVGSAKEGLCPENYSIWHILDLFLQTGYSIPYAFKIIPVDILAEIIVMNLLEDRNGYGEEFIRPALKHPITHKHFQTIATNLFGLELTDRQTMHNATVSKRKFNFMIPKNFYSLLEKVNALPSVMPRSITPASLPDSSLVFLSNLNNKLSEPKYQKYFKAPC